MTSRDFVYWLQGLLEIGDPESLTKEQLTIVKNHLNLVFLHEIDPSLNKGKTKEEVKDLQDVHDGKKKKLSDFAKEVPPLKKDKDVVDWIKDKFKPSHINKPSGGWSSGSTDNTIYRC
jgi:hypothetical protein